MLSSIHPLGERTRNNTWSLTAVAFVAGAVLGGLVTATVLGVVAVPVGGAISTTTRWALLGVAGLLAVAVDAVLDGRPLPSWHRQVNEDWLGRYRGWVYGAGFGFQLGTGWCTFITTGLVYLVALAAVLTGSLPGALVVGGTFGLTRGVLILAAAPVRTPEALRALHRQLDRAARPARVAAGLTAAATVGVSVGAIW
ncbi:MAG: hypothetical protein OEW85_05905 [Acidimicrobiia bacterium]|nr:hypothetical protein [Acidimicrobiia bacterium]